MCSFERGAGFEPATDGLQVRCSTQLSYPVVGVQVSNLTLRVAPALSPGELPPASSWPHSCVLPAYATAAPRAPAGMKIRAAGNIRQYFPDYPRRSADNVVHPILLIGRVNDGFPPRATRAGASPRGAHAPVAAVPLPQGVRQHAWMLQGRTCRFRIGKPCWWVVRGRTQKPLRMPGKKKPPGFQDPRAFAVPREIAGGRSPVESTGVSGCPPCARRAPLPAHAGPRRAAAASCG